MLSSLWPQTSQAILVVRLLDRIVIETRWVQQIWIDHILTSNHLIASCRDDASVPRDGPARPQSQEGQVLCLMWGGPLSAMRQGKNQRHVRPGDIVPGSDPRTSRFFWSLLLRQLSRVSRKLGFTCNTAYP
jgi:hypothetical protein